MENDAIEEYKSSLSDLNCNSKPMINALTIIAEENLKFAQQVVQVIETHINTASADLKLPVLYLIDSIMKNVGRDYRSLFSERIVFIFSSVFEKVDEKTRFLLYKLRQTWTAIMPNEKLYAIDVSVNQMDPAWPITSKAPPVKSMHISPKFLNASSKKETVSCVMQPNVTRVCHSPTNPRLVADSESEDEEEEEMEMEEGEGEEEDEEREEEEEENEEWEEEEEENEEHEEYEGPEEYEHEAEEEYPEESASVKEVAKQQEVVKQLLAKQERLRLRRVNEEAKEAEKKVHKGPTVVHVHPSETVGIDVQKESSTQLEHEMPEHMTKMSMKTKMSADDEDVNESHEEPPSQSTPLNLYLSRRRQKRADEDDTVKKFIKLENERVAALNSISDSLKELVSLKKIKYGMQNL